MPAPPIGLDITPTALIAVALKKKGKTYAIDKRAVAPLAHGIVVDGEVHDVAALASAMSELWEREGFRNKSVAVGVANQRCLVRMIDLPKIKKKSEIKNAIGFEVGDTLPIPLEDAVWDAHPLPSYKDAETGNERQKHVVVMVYRESVERYRDAVLAAGLKLQRIDLAAFALMRSSLPAIKAAAAPAVPGEEAAAPVVALCDIGPTSTNLVIVRNDVCEMNRIVSFGSDIFGQTLSEQFGWSLEDAQRVKLEAGVVAPGGMEVAGDPYGDTRRVMQYVADQFSAELRTSFDYYTHSSEGGLRVSQVVLAGEGALLRGIDGRFAAELGVPVSIIDASAKLDAPSVEELGASQAQFGTALGLAMEEAA